MKRSVATNLAGLILLLGGLAGCGGKTAAKPHDAVLVFAAASTTNAMDDIKSRFEQESGIDVHANYAASSTLAQQIVHGADADIFLSADIQWADCVAATAAEGRRRNLLGNRLVIIVPADSTLKIQDPRDSGGETPSQHLAVGDPASVPIGKYAKRALEKLAIWDQAQEQDRCRRRCSPGAGLRGNRRRRSGNRLRHRCRDQQEGQGGVRHSREADRSGPLSPGPLEAWRGPPVRRSRSTATWPLRRPPRCSRSMAS